jgi:hypothetical protein
VTGPRHRRGFAAWRAVALLAAVAAVVLGAHFVGSDLFASTSSATVARPAAVGSSVAGQRAGAAGQTAGVAQSAGRIGRAGGLAPNGTFTTPGGAVSTIAALRGAPAMVWFVAGGCASCAASIPAVATHLTQIRRDGVEVVTLGLWGDFPNGRRGATALVAFGRRSAGRPVLRPGWTWGMASRALSIAYDPTGTPDAYVLIGPNGHVRYRNSVPDSTMGQLLAAARLLGGRRAR